MVFGFRSRRRRREELRAQPFPPEWLLIVQGKVPVFNRLPEGDQAELLGHIQVLLSEKTFEGCGGLEMNDEIRLTIAAQAALLLLHRDTDYFPQLETILVYPSGYTDHSQRYVDDGIWEEGPDDRLGHTAEGLRALVLAWDAVRHGALRPSDGENLVLHEFAHQLDFEDPGADGTPALAARSDFEEWRKIMARELASLRAADDAGEDTLLDPYGATDFAELFAVATETFFERPRAMKEHHPELYAAMQRFFNQDPTEYSGEASIPDWFS